MKKIMLLFARVFFFLVVVSTTAIYAQKTQNYVVINASDNEQDIIAKAANVTPSPRQLRWQQLELTAFVSLA